MPPPRRYETDRRGHQAQETWPCSHARPWLRCTSGLEFWSMTTLPLSEVKARLSEIAEEVAATHERVQITKNGRDYVVLLAAEDLESIEATLELLRDPGARSRTAHADEEIQRGDVLDEAQVRALLAARRSGSTE
jgi:antitoxin YefM